MKLHPKKIVIRSLMFVALGAAGLIVVDQTTHWPLTVKLVWPIGWVIIAILHIILCLYQNASADDTPKPQTSSIKSSWTTTLTATTKTKEAPKESAIMTIVSVIVGFLLVALVIMGVGKLLYLIQASNRDFIKNSRQVVVTNPFGIASGCDHKVDIDKFLIADPGKVYDVFELKKDQHWRCYVQREFEYRIKVTGQEPFILLPRLADYQTEVTADRAGLLQIRTKHKNHAITVERLIPCTIK